MTDEADRARGVLLGLAVGDHNGGPTQMALRLAESLNEHRSFNVNDIGSRYLAWWQEGAFDTGPTAARVLELVDSGLPFTEASARVHRESGGRTAGCNPAHRAAPLAMLASLTDDVLLNAASKEAALTHYDPIAGDVSAAVVLVGRALIRGVEWIEAVQAATQDRMPQTRAALTSSLETPTCRGGYAPNVLAAAVFFIGSSDTFNGAVKSALEFAGPANYCPVIVGSLAGARFGASGIDHNLLPDLRELSIRLEAAASGLAATW